MTGAQVANRLGARSTERMAMTPHESTAPPLPQNLDAERSVLGAILLDNQALNAAIENVKPDDFALDHHRRIFNHMIELGEAQQAIDLVTLSDQLHRKGELEAAGGAAYLAHLVDGVPRVTHLEHYAKIVREKAMLRRLAYAGHQLQQEALADEEDASVIIARASEVLSHLHTGSSDFRSMFHSFEDFESAAPLSFAIKGFLQNNGATLIGGLSGHGKTLVMLSIARALLSGRGSKLWDYFEVMENAVRVLYLIPECSIEPFKYRLKLFGLYDYLAPSDGRLLVRTLSKGPTPCLSDPRILHAAKGGHVFLDTAVRFTMDGDENSAGDNQRGLAADIFALLAAGARTVQGAHHAPKPFARENVMRLENVLRGSGDIGAMVSTAWGIKQIDAAQNIVHIENIKPRDFQPPQPFQIIGRPHIDQAGDFALYKRPGDCGSLMDEQEPERERGGGAPQAVRDARAANLALMRGWLRENPGLTSPELARMFSDAGIKVGDSAIRKYRKELRA